MSNNQSCSALIDFGSNFLKAIFRPLYLTYFAFFISFSCNQSNGPIKLTSDELIERARVGNFPNPKTIIYKNEKGDIIAMDSLEKLKRNNDLAFDNYVNELGIVIEQVVRKAKKEDDILKEKIKKAIEEGPVLKKISINCDYICSILDEVLEADQNNRKNMDKFSWEVDLRNLELVTSILDVCGFPKKGEVERTQIIAIWLVIQHASLRYQKHYFPLFKKAAESGDIDARHVYMLEDRILVSEGKPQIYGTQVHKNEDGVFELYETIDPEYLNYRRAKVGFEHINDYLSQWGINFNIKQKKIKNN